VAGTHGLSIAVVTGAGDDYGLLNPEVARHSSRFFLYYRFLMEFAVDRDGRSRAPHFWSQPRLCCLQ